MWGLNNLNNNQQKENKMKTTENKKQNENVIKVINQQNENKMKTTENKKESVLSKINAISKNAELKTCLGQKQTSIYKDEIFKDCTDKEKKTIRRKLRNFLYSFVQSEVNTKNAHAFAEFYAEFYRVNDYSLSSVCNENLGIEKKQQLTTFLENIKKELEK